MEVLSMMLNAIDANDGLKRKEQGGGVLSENQMLLVQ